MKKISMLFLCFLMVFFIAGCGKTEDKEQTLVCTATESEDGMSIEQVISMTYKNDKLSHMKMEVNTKITDSDIQNNWDSFKKSMDSNNEEMDEDGVSLKVVIDDEKFEYNTILDIDVLNASEEALSKQGFSDLKNDNSTIEENKEESEKDGYTCTIK